MEQQLAELKQQLEIEQRIVPDEKQVDGFITMLDGEAQKAGVELRRYTAKDTKSQQYYTEVPFDLELDGPYYSVLNFFDRVSKLERIVNISGLLVATTKNPSASEGEAHVSVRAQRKRHRDFHGDHILQSRFDNLQRQAPGRNRERRRRE